MAAPLVRAIPFLTTYRSQATWSWFQQQKEFVKLSNQYFTKEYKMSEQHMSIFKGVMKVIKSQLLRGSTLP